MEIKLHPEALGKLGVLHPTQQGGCQNFILRNRCACKEGKRRFRGVLFFLQINYEFGFSKARSIKVFSITPVTGTIITNQAKYNAVAT